MEINDEQRAAIESVDKNTIVAASAGSGKTTLTTEKISRMLMNTLEYLDGPINVQNMLIVTFTKASANDLKAKISKNIKDLISSLPEGEQRDFLRMQLEDLPLASISTLHSLCANVIRENYDKLNIDPSFTIMEEEESGLLLNRAIQTVLTNHMTDCTDEYVAIYDYFGSDLAKSLASLYAFIKINIDVDAYVEEKALSTYVDNAEELTLVQRYKKNIQRSLGKYIEQLTEYRNLVVAENNAELSKLIVLIDEAIAKCQFVINASMDELKSNQTYFKKEAKGSVTKTKVTEEQLVLKESFNVYRKKIFKALEDIHKDASLDMPTAFDKQIALKLISLVREVETEYLRLKTGENKLDFNDLEQKMVQLLKDQDVLSSLREKYEYICVDEYQDINVLQEEVLRSISNGKNMFMVGDVKQSIYGFRQTDPTIFLNKVYLYEDCAEEGKTIYLNKNYRSRQNVIDFVNTIFNATMDKEFSGVDYEKSAQLKCGNKDYAETNYETEVGVVVINKKTEPEQIALDEDGVYSVRTHLAMGNREDSRISEGQFIANKIKELVGKKYKTVQKKIGDKKVPVKELLTYRDIMILCRSRDDTVKEIVNIIAENGIPIDAGNVMQSKRNEAVDLLIALLSVIDNRKQDVDLTTVLLSPFGDFSLSDLSQIRQATKRINNDNFYNAFYLYDKKDEIGAKIDRFNKLIDDYQFKARYMSVNELVDCIVSDNLFDEYVLSKPAGKKLLFQLRTFMNGLKGKTYNMSISKFLSVCREYSSLNESSAVVPIAEDCVATATVHASKGLEYPVVFLVNCDKGFNFDYSSKIKKTKDDGIILRHIDTKERFYKNTIVSSLSKNVEENNLITEEIRLFYVALTRAREYLYLTGISKLKQYGDTDFYYDEIKSFTNIVDMAAVRTPGFDKYIIKTDTETDQDGAKEDKKDRSLHFEEPDDNLFGELNKYMINDYKYLDSTKRSIVRTVTELNKASNEDNDDMISSAPEFEQLYNDMFDGKVEYNNSKKTEVGTAYHKVLELIDFNCFSVEDVEEEMNRLVIEGLMSSEQKELVNSKEIYECLVNPLFERARNTLCEKEKKFKMYIPEDDVLHNGNMDKILLQGTIDLFIPKSINNDQNILVDYKFSRENVDVIRERYKTQLDLYQMALEECAGIKVDRKLIYVLGANKIIEY